MQVAIIGGGAAGFFAALSVKEHHPNAEVILFEKSSKVLSKVKVSGGGRCNVTHSCFNIPQLIKHYPRGSRFLKKAFHQFNTNHAVEWFEQRRVKLHTESDGRMFPDTNDSQTIIDCLNDEVERLGVQVRMSSRIESIQQVDQGLILDFGNNNQKRFEKVIVATGGSPKMDGLLWLKDLGHRIESPVPSLFTFNMPKESIKELMGTVAPMARVKIQGSKLQASGPVLITHWGMSGPGILKLSAFGARELADRHYTFKVQINWLNLDQEEEVRSFLMDALSNNSRAKLANLKFEQLPKRLWHFLLAKLEINAETICAELGKKAKNRLINSLFNDEYEVQGKTTFKEEFVTCGGVSLSDINPNTMESRVVPGLYFTGEVMDIDGVTGGFNFQAAWTTGFIAGKLSI